MPFKSQAQQRAMHAKADRGEISQETVREFDAATKHLPGGFQDLPERVKKAAYVAGVKTAVTALGMAAPPAPLKPIAPPQAPKTPKPATAPNTVMQMTAANVANKTSQPNDGSTSPIAG